MPPDRTRRGPGRNPGTRQITATNGKTQDTAAELEALRFLDGARRWIDHGVAGDVGIAEAAVAAMLLAARAERLAA
jgi:hypothetical protein